jgi:septal ring factor EnvC (AmiA/AmiB activator)
MEKRISFTQFNSVKSVAKAIDPYLRDKARLEAQLAGIDEEFRIKAEEQLEKLKEKIKNDMAAKKEKLEAEIQKAETEISTIEAGIVSIIGFHVTDLVKKVIEPNAKGAKETKYLPTDIVSYDEQNKQYVITVSDESAETPVVPPTTEDVAGSDYDKDVAENTESVEENLFN